MYTKISQGQEATMDGMLDINYPSAGSLVQISCIFFNMFALLDSLVCAYVYLDSSQQKLACVYVQPI